MKNDSKWVEIIIELPGVAPIVMELVTDRLLEIGSPGICASGVGGELLPEEDPRSEDEVRAYLPIDDCVEEKLEALRDYCSRLEEEFPGTSIRVRRGERSTISGWARRWMSHYRPVPITPSIIVYPAWEEATPATGETAVFINPGMAFGTGGHPTTRLCASTMVEVLEDRAGEFNTLLDLGTGSGILAICAAVTGIPSVTAVDCDPDAVESALRNIALNQVGERINIVCGTADCLNGTFDLVVANLDSREFAGAIGSVAALTGPEGSLICSGLLCEEADNFRASLQSLDMIVVDTRESEGWTCMVLGREAGSRP